MCRICQHVFADGHVYSLRQRPAVGGKYSGLHQLHLEDSTTPLDKRTVIHNCKMSVSSTSGAMLRRTIFNVRSAARPLGAAESRAARSSVFGSYRSVHRSARLPAITASEARHRPSLRPHQQSSRVTGLSPNSKRSIFIQTENTPNPDVRIASFPLRSCDLTNTVPRIGFEIHS